MRIVLLTRRNVGLIALSWLVAKGYDVYVISDDEDVLWLAERLGVEAITMAGISDGDMLLSVHWHKIIPKEYLENRIAVNVHPMLFKYKGHNPVKRVIENGDELGSVESHVMTSVVDEGTIIHQEFFQIPKCDSYEAFYNIAFNYYYKILEGTFKKLNINP